MERYHVPVGGRNGVDLDEIGPGGGRVTGLVAGAL